MTDVLATAADEFYGYHALNLVGSVKRHSDVFDRIEVFDLGLSPHQRFLLGAVPGVVIRPVPPFVQHWAQCFTWKPWVWMQVEADRVFWLDAGASVLRSLSRALDQISELGYFLVSQNAELSDILPPGYFESYDLPSALAERSYICAGILGFRPGSDFFDRVLAPTYDDCLAGRNLGFSPAELSHKNRGLGYMESPPVRDCAQFRWDQSILNAHLFAAMPHAEIADMDEYGGWRSPRDHPKQVIWHHRRRGNLRYLKRIPYSGRGAWKKRAWGIWWQLRWWKKLNERFLMPTTYKLKARVLRDRYVRSFERPLGRTSMRFTRKVRRR